MPERTQTAAAPAPLALDHSWPLFERDARFELGALTLGGDGANFDSASLFGRGLGAWECDLASGALLWSAKVYDLFGLPRGSRSTRAESVALYAERSRAIMERLRSYAIRHRRGFTLDAELRPATGGIRWMRLIASPICEGDRVVRLCGLKRDVTAEYR